MVTCFSKNGDAKMISRAFSFFSFMLGWSLIAGRLTGIPFPLVMIPILVTVSGWRYTGYFFALNVIVNMPSITLWESFTAYYLKVMDSAFATVNRISSTTSASSTSFIPQFSNPTLNAIAVSQSSMLQSMPPWVSLPLLVLMSYLVFRYSFRVFRAYHKMYRMVKAVIRKRGSISRY
jgi:hypothetical protein